MSQLKRYRSVVADSARWEGFRFRPGDIVISTPPKCGTTWMQRLVALLVFDDTQLYAPISRISPWLDMQLAPLEEVAALLDAQRHRRFIKTHTPLDGIPADDGVTYVCVGRDPRDVAVSGAHHMANMNIDRFLNARQAAVGLDDLPELGLAAPGPRPQPTSEEQLRSWITEDSDVTPMTLWYLVRHLRMCWERRDRPNVALFHYDDLLLDLPGQMRRLADALSIDISDSRLVQLATEATFAAMRARAEHTAPNADISLWHDTQQFFHRGTSGQWHDVFSDDDLRAYDVRLAELAPPDLVAWLHSGWLGLPTSASPARTS
jgi:aryl sulfotransferase